MSKVKLDMMIKLKGIVEFRRLSLIRKVVGQFGIESQTKKFSILSTRPFKR